MTDAPYSIGDVTFTHVDATNPYMVPSPCGKERERLFKQFRDGELPSDVAVWYAPVVGGAVRITDPNQVRGLFSDYYQKRWADL